MPKVVKCGGTWISDITIARGEGEVSFRVLGGDRGGTETDDLEQRRWRVASRNAVCTSKREGC